MRSKNPPAFPRDAVCENGMSLRDYFAAAALPAFVKAHIDQSVDDFTKQEIARECYSFADFMLAERAKEQKL